MSNKTSKYKPADVTGVVQSKKAYSAPQLVYFGTIRELTAAGSSGKAEQMSGMGSPAKRV